MKRSAAKTVMRLIQKLEEQGDISLEEAGWIYSFFSKDRKIKMINPDSPEFNSDLARSLYEWYKAAGQKILNGSRGNFIHTILLDNSHYSNTYMLHVHDALKKCGTFEDVCTFIMVDKKLHFRLPFKHLLKETTTFGSGPEEESFYVMISPRAGTYYYPINTGAGSCTIKQVMKKFSPAITITSSESGYLTNEIVFEIASGARKLSLLQNPMVLSGKEIMAYVLGDFLHRRNIPCIAAIDELRGESVLFVEKGNAPVMRKVLKIPFKELVKNALEKNAVNKTDAEMLLKHSHSSWMEISKFVEANRKLVDDMVETMMEWETEREAAKDEDIWLDEMR